MKIYNPNKYVLGKSFSEWTAAYWQWILPIPSDKNPYYDRTGEYSSLDQKGPVYFFSNAPENSKIHRRTSIE